MDLIKDVFKNLKVHKDVLDYLENDRSCGIFGWSEGATGAFSYTLSDEFSSIIIVCKDESRSKKVVEDIKSLGKPA